MFVDQYFGLSEGKGVGLNDLDSSDDETKRFLHALIIIDSGSNFILVQTIHPIIY